MRFGNIKVCRGTIISIIGGGALGALAGGVAGYIVNKLVYKKKIDGYIYDWYKHYDKPIGHGEIEETDDGIVVHATINDDHIKELIDDDGVYAEVMNFNTNPLAKSNALKEELAQKIYKANASMYGDAADRSTQEDVLDDDEDEVEHQNIFDTVDPDEEEAMAKADIMGGQPYVISYEEYFETCKDFVKTTIGWYPKENILTDENNEPIPEDEWSNWVGDDGLNMFGQGPSYDGDVVFIRNPYTHHDYEVIRFAHEKYEEDTVGAMNE